MKSKRAVWFEGGFVKALLYVGLVNRFATGQIDVISTDINPHGRLYYNDALTGRVRPHKLLEKGRPSYT